MNKEDFQKVDEIFDAALNLPKESRADFLAEKCTGDADLHREVLSLLEAEEKAQSFLQNSAMNLMAKKLADEQPTIVNGAFIGKEFAVYKIEKLLGVGGMGEVYLAYDRKLKRKVALKILPAEFLADAERIKRFEREARAVSAMNHPNIVTIYDFGITDGINFIATEFVEGKTLRELIAEGVDLKQTLVIISQVCEALAAAHNAGIIHRDIKPENIMLRPDGYVKVLDFGLAKLTEYGEFQPQSLSNVTKKGMIIGTLAYMSPEQISDEKVDHRTDLWSLGVILYEMLTGKNPFKLENRQATLNAILSVNPPLISEIKPSLPRELDGILSKALEKDADVSYQTASDFRADLKRVRREIDSSPSLRSFETNAKKRDFAKKKINFLAYLFGSIAFASTAIGVWFFLKSPPTDTKTEATDWVNAKNLQLTATSGTDGYPSLAPDGKSFVFASDTGDNRDIYLQRVGGKNAINLTANSKENDTMPAFSFDGKFIAFRSEREPSGIYVMEQTGENVRRIADFGFHPAWSPDGKKIVVSDRAAAIHTAHVIPNSSLWILDVVTGQKNKPDTKGDAINPNWSPNGRHIAYWYVAEGKLSEIAIISPETGEISIVTNNSSNDWNPVWSPDGKYLYFASDRSGNMNFWRVAIDEKTGQVSGLPESVPTPSKYCRHITFSRDGKRLAYVRYESQSNLQTIAFDAETGKTSGEINWITRGDREISNPDLSPNGEEFVARYPTRTQEDLAVFNRDGSNWRTLSDDKFRERVPRWSPDGKSIAFHSDKSGKQQIWTINPDGTNPQQITFSEKTGVNYAVFSPDGSRLAFTEINDKLLRPFILDLTKTWREQTPEPLPPMPNYAGSFAVRDWSSDGEKLLILFFESDGDENGIGIFNLKTATYEKITATGSSPVWLNDNRRFIFNDQRGVFLGDSQTKKVTEIVKPSAYEIQHPNISPDNKTIYFRYLQVEADVWLLDASEN